MQKPKETFWGPFGNLLGAFWEPSGSLWEPSGSLVGAFWESLGTFWKQNFDVLNFKDSASRRTKAQALKI